MFNLNEKERQIVSESLSILNEQCSNTHNGLSVFIDQQVNAKAAELGVSETVLLTMMTYERFDNFNWRELDKVFNLMAQHYGIDIHNAQSVMISHCRKRLFKELLTEMLK